MSNPFAQTMVRLQLPPDSGRSISARGFEVEADEDGCVEVPRDLASELRAHGLTDAPAAAPKAAGKK